nr:kinetochore protein mis13 [Quercus suber]
MSQTLTRSPLTAITMNGAGTRRKRRSARLSGENGGEEGEGRGTGGDEEVGAGEAQVAKKLKMTGPGGTAATSKVGTKAGDGDSNKLASRGRGYDETVDDFSFRRGRSRRGKEPEQIALPTETPPVIQQDTSEAKPAQPAKSIASEAKPVVRKANKVYSEKVDDFSFNKGRGRRGKATQNPPVQNSSTHEAVPSADPTPAPDAIREAPPLPKATAQRERRPIPDTPAIAATGRSIRRSKRLSDENGTDPQPSPQRPGHAKSHQNTTRSPSPQLKARPVTVEKKRKKNSDDVDESEKTMRIHLPFQDTPVIRRNKEMRKNSGDGHRRSSTGLRGRRVSSLIDEGRGNAIPHAEVPTAEFFKHISADLTEPRRMRCLLGWCGARALPSKPEAPKDNSPAASLEFQASQAETPSATGSDGTSRPLRRYLCAGNLTRATLPMLLKQSSWNRSLKGQFPGLFANNERGADVCLARRLKKEKSEWETLLKSATSAVTPASPSKTSSEDLRSLSPIHGDHLDSPQRAILTQLQTNSDSSDAPPAAVDVETLETNLRHLSSNLEFSVDQFAHGVHAVTTAKTTADRVAERTFTEAAAVLEHREHARGHQGADAVNSLRALGKLLNGKFR